MIVFKATDPDGDLLKGCEFVKGTGGSRRDEYIELKDLDPGEYYIFA